MRPLRSVLIHSVGWHLSELLDLIPTPIDHSGSVTGKVPERITEKEKKIIKKNQEVEQKPGMVKFRKQ